MEQTILKLGTRGSPLALWQAHHVKVELAHFHPEISVEIVVIKTQGDVILDQPLSQIGGKALFLKEIESALLENKVDFAVHSLKDVPVQMTEELGICAVLPRENSSDALLSSGDKFEELKPGSCIGTSSVRRVAQLSRLRPDLNFVALRGNVDTRLKKLDQGQVDGLVLAAAGLIRLGFESRITQYLEIIPAVSQGAIAIEIRQKNESAARILSCLNDPVSALCVAAERAFSKILDGSCQTPLGCHVQIVDDHCQIDSFLSDLSGTRIIERSGTCDPAKAELTAISMAKDILENGGDEILKLLTTK